MESLQIVSGKISCALKVVVYGPEGIGKSTMASQFPRPVFIDTEGSTKLMDVNRTPKPTSWAMLLEQVRYFKSYPHVYGTLVIDTADWAEQLCVTEVCAKSQKTGIEEFGYGKGYVYLSEEFGKLLNLLEDVVNSGTHVVLTAHAWMRKFEQPDEMGSYDRWEMKLGKKTAPLVKEWADVVLFANYKTMVVNVDGQGTQKGKNKVQGGRRVMYANHHSCWDAKNRLGLPDELPFDYAELAQFFECSASAPIAQYTQAPEDIAQPLHREEPIMQVVQARTPNSEPVNTPQIVQGGGALIALRDLMKQNNVMAHEIQAVVADRGYFPEGTPLENYPEDFVAGVLVGAWSKVCEAIVKSRPLPF